MSTGIDTPVDVPADVLDRARGVLYGQLIGDSLGAQVEMRSAADIAAEFPGGVRDLTGGGPHGIAPGQGTDDSEMALALARSLVRKRGFDAVDVRASYVRWANSGAFSMGHATTAALIDGTPDENSQANGALMRVSPLAVAYWRDPIAAADSARADAAITHPNRLTVAASAAYSSALADVVAGGKRAAVAVGKFVRWLEVETGPLGDAPDFSVHQGWVRLALWALLAELKLVAAGATDFEQSLVRVIGRGGDTDTNAAIVGAFVGGVFGAEAIATRWRDVVDQCVPAMGRPAEYHPNDIFELAGQLARVRAPEAGA